MPLGLIRSRWTLAIAVTACQIKSHTQGPGSLLGTVISSCLAAAAWYSKAQHRIKTHLPLEDGAS